MSSNSLVLVPKRIAPLMLLRKPVLKREYFCVVNMELKLMCLPFIAMRLTTPAAAVLAPTPRHIPPAYLHPPSVAAADFPGDGGDADW